MAPLGNVVAAMPVMKNVPAGRGAGGQIAVDAASLPYMSRARLWPRIAERMSSVSVISCARAKSISSSAWGWSSDCAIVSC